jgi:hypothetical protein
MQALYRSAPPLFYPARHRVQVAADSVSHTAVVEPLVASVKFCDTLQLFQKKWLGEPKIFEKYMLKRNTVLKILHFLLTRCRCKFMQHSPHIEQSIID